MKTRTKLLRKTAHAVMIAALLCVAGMTKVALAQPLNDWEQHESRILP